MSSFSVSGGRIEHMTAPPKEWQDAQGYIQKADPKQRRWQRRWFVFDGERITYSDSPTGTVKGIVNLRLPGVTVSDAKIEAKGVLVKPPPTDWTLVISQPGRLMKLAFSSGVERDVWLDYVKAGIEGAHNSGATPSEIEVAVDAAVGAVGGDAAGSGGGTGAGAGAAGAAGAGAGASDARAVDEMATVTEDAAADAATDAFAAADEIARERAAAIRIQALYRRRAAKKRVAALRAKRAEQARQLAAQSEALLAMSERSQAKAEAARLAQLELEKNVAVKEAAAIARAEMRLRMCIVRYKARAAAAKGASSAAANVDTVVALTATYMLGQLRMRQRVAAVIEESEKEVERTKAIATIQSFGRTVAARRKVEEVRKQHAREAAVEAAKLEAARLAAEAKDQGDLRKAVQEREKEIYEAKVAEYEKLIDDAYAAADALQADKVRPMQERHAAALASLKAINKDMLAAGDNMAARARWEFKRERRRQLEELEPLFEQLREYKQSVEDNEAALERLQEEYESRQLKAAKKKAIALGQDPDAAGKRTSAGSRRKANKRKASYARGAVDGDSGAAATEGEAAEKRAAAKSKGCLCF